LKNGASTDEKNKDNYTALLITCKSYTKQQDYIADLLIEYGADLNMKDKKGLTALDYAIENKNEYVTNLLRKAGAKRRFENH
jgi:ankyrin repeat protein